MTAQIALKKTGFEFDLNRTKSMVEISFVTQNHGVLGSNSSEHFEQQTIMPSHDIADEAPAR